MIQRYLGSWRSRSQQGPSQGPRLDGWSKFNNTHLTPRSQEHGEAPVADSLWRARLQGQLVADSAGAGPGGAHRSPHAVVVRRGGLANEEPSSNGPLLHRGRCAVRRGSDNTLVGKVRFNLKVGPAGGGVVSGPRAQCPQQLPNIWEKNPNNTKNRVPLTLMLLAKPESVCPWSSEPTR